MQLFGALLGGDNCAIEALFAVRALKGFINATF
jgi:hypothetical protein